MDTVRNLDPRPWLWWTLAAVAGWAIGEFLFRVSGELVWGALLFRGAHVLGVGVAVLQGLVLHRHLAQAGWWILATGVAAVLSGIAVLAATADVLYIIRGIEVSSVASIALSVLGSGLLVGCSQWLILRRHVARAGWWIPVSGLSLVVGWLVGAIVLEYALAPPEPSGCVRSRRRPLERRRLRRHHRLHPGPTAPIPNPRPQRHPVRPTLTPR